MTKRDEALRLEFEALAKSDAVAQVAERFDALLAIIGNCDNSKEIVACVLMAMRD